MPTLRPDDPKQKARLTAAKAAYELAQSLVDAAWSDDQIHVAAYIEQWQRLRKLVDSLEG